MFDHSPSNHLFKLGLERMSTPLPTDAPALPNLSKHDLTDIDEEEEDEERILFP